MTKDMHVKLGRLETLSAQSVWGNEPQVFTPWLAENLDLLAEALQLDDLELQGTEVAAGDFRLDILAEDGEGNPVLVENQFGATDHRHLGQLISYVASQNRRATVVWVAERFKDDHRAAIDWLNSATSDEYAFFAVEIEALRIGDSVPAPFFNVVAKPNNWTRTLRAASVGAGGPILAERHQQRIAYWTGFSAFLRAEGSTFTIRRQVKDHWFNFPIGRSGVVIGTTISSQKKRISVELYMSRDALKAGFRQLLEARGQIEREIGESLEWQELPGKQASRIALFKTDVDPFSSAEQPALYAWMLDRMQRFRSVFGQRVRALDFDSEDDTVDAILG